MLQTAVRDLAQGCVKIGGPLGVQIWENLPMGYPYVEETVHGFKSSA